VLVQCLDQISGGLVRDINLVNDIDFGQLLLRESAGKVSDFLSGTRKDHLFPIVAVASAGFCVQNDNALLNQERD